MYKSIFLSNRELESLSKESRLLYFNELKKHCLTLKNRNKGNLGRTFIQKANPFLRNYDYIFEGEKNIPQNGSAIFVCNHSNSHDILTAIEVFKNLGIDISVLVASDDLTPSTRAIFTGCDTILFDRRNKREADRAVLELAAKLLNGQRVLIFGEATWNLHPIKLMQTIKIGAANLGAITGSPVIPMTFEYLEVNEPCNKESQLYKICYVRFNSSLDIKCEENLVTQTGLIQENMEEMRRVFREREGIKKNTLNDIDPELYVNHTYLKKFDGFGFTYDSLSESKYLFSHDNKPVENEYWIDENGLFVPGITTKTEGKRYVKKK